MTDFALFHRTSIGQARTILKHGFEDGKWSFERDSPGSGQPVKVVGVWLSDRPLGNDEGPSGDAVIAVSLTLSEESLAAYRLDGVVRDAQLWVVPAAVVNAHAVMRIHEVDPRTSWWHDQEKRDE